MDYYKRLRYNKKIGIKNWLWIIPKDKLKEIQIVFYQNKKLLGCE